MTSARHPTAIPLLLTFVFVLLNTATGRAEWRRIDSPNFVVVGDVGARTLRDVAVKFEGFRETLTRVLTERATATAVPTVVIVFPSDRAFTPFKPKYDGRPVEIGGLFVARQDMNYIAMVPGAGPDALRIVFHEYAHLVVSNVARNVPAWLSEGLAEYYSTYEVSDGGREAVLGRALVSHLQLLNDTPLLKVAALLKVDHESPLYNERDRRSVFYAQSWALTHMILMGETPRAKQLIAYLQRVDAGESPAEAWVPAFGTRDIDRELYEYTRRRTFRAVQYKFPEKLATFDATPANLSAADGEAFLSEFLIHCSRPDEAAARLDAAAALDPRNVRLEGLRAALEIARNQLDTAEKRLLAIDTPADWLTAYGAGVNLADIVQTRRQNATAEQLQAVRRLFDAVRQQRGEIPNAIARLVDMELRSADGVTPATRTAIERARLMALGRDDYVLLHAQVLARLSEYSAARNLLGPMMGSNQPPELREYARSLMQHVVRLETAAQRDVARLTGQDVPAPSPSQPPDAGSRPSGGFTPVYRDLQPGEERVEGSLERIECLSGGSMVFHLRGADGPFRATAPRMTAVEFITYRDDLTGSVQCGPLAPAMRVYLTWRPSGEKGSQKTVAAIEFLPKADER